MTSSQKEKPKFITPGDYAIAILHLRPKLRDEAMRRVPAELRKKVEHHLDDEILQRRVLRELRRGK